MISTRAGAAADRNGTDGNDPMPEVVRPMLAEPGSLPDDERGWRAELKWDGIRAIASQIDGQITLRGRSGDEISNRFPEINPPQVGGNFNRLILDGELVAFDESGKPSFQRIQRRLRNPSGTGGQAALRAVTFVVFDLLYVDGSDLRNDPYSVRRERLFDLQLRGERWQVPESLSSGFAEFAEATKTNGLEGIVLKRQESPYRSGQRRHDWLKVKNTLRQEFVVGGWLPGKGGRSNTFGALLVGYQGDGAERRDPEQVLHYAGRVGSGFSSRDLAELSNLLVRSDVSQSPFILDPGGSPASRIPQSARFVEPIRVIEVEFTQWTEAGLLRHPVFRGIRSDKDAESVYRESHLGH